MCLARNVSAGCVSQQLAVPTDTIRRGPVSRSRMRFYIYIRYRAAAAAAVSRSAPPGRDLNLVRARRPSVWHSAASPPRGPHRDRALRTNYVTALTGMAAAAF